MRLWYRNLTVWLLQNTQSREHPSGKEYSLSKSCEKNKGERRRKTERQTNSNKTSVGYDFTLKGLGCYCPKSSIHVYPPYRVVRMSWESPELRRQVAAPERVPDAWHDERHVSPSGKNPISGAVYTAGLSSSLWLWRASGGADTSLDSYKGSRFYIEFCREWLVQKIMDNISESPEPTYEDIDIFSNKPCLFINIKY